MIWPRRSLHLGLYVNVLIATRSVQEYEHWRQGMENNPHIGPTFYLFTSNVDLQRPYKPIYICQN